MLVDPRSNKSNYTGYNAKDCIGGSQPDATRHAKMQGEFKHNEDYPRMTFPQPPKPYYHTPRRALADDGLQAGREDEGRAEVKGSSYHDELRARRNKAKATWEASLPGGEIAPQNPVHTAMGGCGPAQGILGGANHVQGDHSGAGAVFRHPDVYPRFSTRDVEWQQWPSGTHSKGANPNQFGFCQMYVDEGKREADFTLENETMQGRWPQNQFDDGVCSTNHSAEKRSLGNPLYGDSMHSPSKHDGAWRGASRSDLFGDLPENVASAWNHAGRYPFLMDPGERFADRTGPHKSFSHPSTPPWMGPTPREKDRMASPR